MNRIVIPTTMTPTPGTYDGLDVEGPIFDFDVDDEAADDGIDLAGVFDDDDGDDEGSGAKEDEHEDNEDDNIDDEELVAFLGDIINR